MSHQARGALVSRSLVLLILALFGSSASLGQDLGAGALRGSVYDKDYASPLAQVRITILEAGLAVLTQADGNFFFPRVPAGTYTVSIAKDGYDRQVRSGVTVVPGQVAELRADLASEVVTMPELIVIGEDLFANADVGLLDIRADALVVQDAISADLISKAGAGDVAGALKLVVGASVADGKYATVRGLSDRYTGTTLNGVRVPSPDPRKRAVQIDLFPTGTIDAITVTKTFTPDLFGEFTGGSVDIQTKQIPEGFTAGYSQSFEYNDFATFNDEFLTYEGGGVTGSGFAGTARELPRIASHPGKYRLPRFRQRPTEEEIAASNYFNRFTRAFSPVIGTSREQAGINFGFSLNAGDKYELGPEVQLGLLGATSYSHKYDYYADAQSNVAGRTGAGQGLFYDSQRIESKGTDEVLWGALLSSTLKIGEKHGVAARIVGNQSAEDESRVQTESETPTNTEYNQSLRYTERSLVAGQLHGEHEFPKLWGEQRWLQGMDLRWTYAKNFTRQDEPDVRFFKYELSTSGSQPVGNFPNSSTDAQNTRRIFRKIDEYNDQFGLDLSLPFGRLEDDTGRFKFGVYTDQSHRTYGQSSFTWTWPGVFGPASRPDVRENRAKQQFLPTDLSQLWTDIFAAPDRIGLATNQPFAPNQLLYVLIGTGGDVPYSGDQRIDAYYGMIDWPLFERLTLIGGARHEETRIALQPDTLTDVIDLIAIDQAGNRELAQLPEEEGATDLDQSAWLPAIGLVWEPSEKQRMNIRLNWSRTLARPTFRELAPVAAIEVLQGDEYFGNPELQLSSITNYDLRWEWFPGEGEVVSVSAFYKQIDNPIELISFGVAGRPFVQPVNYETGLAYGFEFELRGSIGSIWKQLAGLSAGLNGTWLETETELPATEQASLAPFGLSQETRRLAGQPEYLLNFSLSYDNPDRGTSAGLFYNLIGETLVSGAARGLTDASPDVYESSYANLDVSFSQKLKGRWSFSVRGKNLLTPQRETIYRTPDDLEAIKSLRETPRLYSVSFGLEW